MPKVDWSRLSWGINEEDPKTIEIDTNDMSPNDVREALKGRKQSYDKANVDHKAPISINVSKTKKKRTEDEKTNKVYIFLDANAANDEKLIDIVEAIYAKTYEYRNFPFSNDLSPNPELEEKLKQKVKQGKSAKLSQPRPDRLLKEWGELKYKRIDDKSVAIIWLKSSSLTQTKVITMLENAKGKATRKKLIPPKCLQISRGEQNNNLIVKKKTTKKVNKNENNQNNTDLFENNTDTITVLLEKVLSSKYGGKPFPFTAASENVLPAETETSLGLFSKRDVIWRSLHWEVSPSNSNLIEVMWTTNTTMDGVRKLLFDSVASGSNFNTNVSMHHTYHSNVLILEKVLARDSSCDSRPMKEMVDEAFGYRYDNDSVPFAEVDPVLASNPEYKIQRPFYLFKDYSDHWLHLNWQYDATNPQEVIVGTSRKETKLRELIVRQVEKEESLFELLEFKTSGKNLIIQNNSDRDIRDILTEALSDIYQWRPFPFFTKQPQKELLQTSQVAEANNENFTSTQAMDLQVSEQNESQQENVSTSFNSQATQNSPFWATNSDNSEDNGPKASKRQKIS